MTRDWLHDKLVRVLWLYGTLRKILGVGEMYTIWGYNITGHFTVSYCQKFKCAATKGVELSVLFFLSGKYSFKWIWDTS